MMVVMAAAMLLPTVAFAIPGAGDLTTIESPAGREMANLYSLLAKICLVIFVLVCSVMFGAILRFRRRSEDERPEQTHGNMKIEMGLLIAATITQIFIGIKTIDVMWYVEKIPETEMTVEVIGYQWDWQFRYPDQGGLVSDDLVIPAYTNVKLEITSKDVIHSLFIPELGVKMDAVPGRYNYWWVNADGPLAQVAAEDLSPAELQARQNRRDTTRPDSEPLVKLLNTLNFVDEGAEDPLMPKGFNVNLYEAGVDDENGGLEQRVKYLSASRTPDDRYAKYDAVEYRGMCTEICGKDHYNMYFRTVAMTPASFKQWLVDQKTGGGKKADGGEIYTGKCASCHGADGQGVGGQFPPLAQSEWVDTDTEENRNRHIQLVLEGLKGEIKVKGVTYNGVMQPWFNVLNDEEVAEVVNHERTSWGNNGGTVTPDDVAAIRKDLGYPPYPAGGATPVDTKDLMAEGETIWSACTSCHGVNGQKGRYKVARSPIVLSDIEGYVSYLVNGTDKKSAMGRSMTDREIAAIITYTRGSFGNDASAVQPAEIKRIRSDVTKPLD